MNSVHTLTHNLFRAQFSLTPRFLCCSFVTNIICAIDVFNFNATCFVAGFSSSVITFGENSRD
jgi:hypothetical protein